jgi:hypothetical protein
MRIAGIYSFNRGREVMESKFTSELSEIERVINAVDSAVHQLNRGKRQGKLSRTLYLPSSLARNLAGEFEAENWHAEEVTCEFSSEYYTDDYKPSSVPTSGVRSLDFVKNGVGVEFQLGKPASDICSICAAMTIFHKLNVIDVGVEIVPLKDFANDMSTSVSYFEQFVWDLEQRGVSDIDIPVLILGVTV